MTFYYPWALLLVPCTLFLYWWQGRRGVPALQFSHRRWSPETIVKQPWKIKFLNRLRLLILLSLALATARPQVGSRESYRYSEGIDIALVIDTSRSMTAMDLLIHGERRNRLDVVKQVVREFSAQRSQDRLSLIVFGTEAFTQVPPTLDHRVLLDFLGRLKIAMAGPETAIGDALATAIKRIKNARSDSKVIVLLTDGQNTAGSVQPRVAAQAAKSLGIKIYAIGIGQDGKVPVPMRGPFGTQLRMTRVEVDKELLRELAAITDGKAFFAETTTNLRQIYRQVDRLEKTEFETLELANYQDLWAWLFATALGMLMLERLLFTTPWVPIP